MKKYNSFLLILFIFVLMFVAGCTSSGTNNNGGDDSGDKPSHTHSYPAIWVNDEFSHWIECECGEKTDLSIHTFGEWVIIKEPTEQTAGSKKQVCSICGYESIVEIPKLDHVHNYYSEIIKPTCENKGYTKYTCSCGDSYIDSEIAALGHTEVIDEAVASTCEETGLTEGKHCSICEKVLVAQEEVAALGHTEAIDEAVASTCEETGLTEGKHCLVCEKVLVAQEEVAALGHTEVIDEAVAATCTKSGLTEGKHCLVCEKVLVAQEEVVALGHNYVDARCTVCNKEEYSKGLNYKLLSNGTYEVTGSGTSTNTNTIIIPNVYNELPVTRIGSNAFKECSSLTKIEIPNSVTSIGNSAFYGCSSLTTVYYIGTSTDWSIIDIDFNNSYLTSATIYYYSEAEPIEEGNYWHYDIDGVTPVAW